MPSPPAERLVERAVGVEAHDRAAHAMSRPSTIVPSTSSPPVGLEVRAGGQELDVLLGVGR
jgi:hypothetical protein